MNSMGPPIGGGAIVFIICAIWWSYEDGGMWIPPRRSVMVHSVQGSGMGSTSMDQQFSSCILFLVIPSKLFLETEMTVVLFSFQIIS